MRETQRGKPGSGFRNNVDQTNVQKFNPIALQSQLEDVKYFTCIISSKSLYSQTAMLKARKVSNARFSMLRMFVC
jgi:hypothetical protein